MARVGRGLSIRGHFSTRLSARQMFTHCYITVPNVCLTRSRVIFISRRVQSRTDDTCSILHHGDLSGGQRATDTDNDQSQNLQYQCVAVDFHSFTNCKTADLFEDLGLHNAENISSFSGRLLLILDVISQVRFGKLPFDAILK